MSDAPPATAPVAETTPESVTPGVVDQPQQSSALPQPQPVASAPTPLGPDGKPVIPQPVRSPSEPVGPTAYIFLALLSISVLAADLGTKWWAVKQLERDGIRLPAREIIKGRLAFVLARNPGGAWGMLHDQ